MQEKQVKTIQAALVAAKQELVNDISGTATNVDIEALAKDISILNRMMEMLHIKKPNAPKTSKTQKATKTPKVKTEAVKTEKSDNKPTRKSRKKNAFSIGDSMTGLRPKNVTVMGATKNVSSFRDLTKAVCEELFIANPNAFKNLQNVTEVNGNGSLYFSSNPEYMNEPTPISSKDGDTFYVDVAKLSGNNMLFLRKALRALGVDEKHISIEIDPNYKRKPRTKEGEA